MKKKMVNLTRNYREAPLRIESINLEERTVDVVWATTTPVLRSYWDETKQEFVDYYEVLSMNPEHIMLGRFAKGLSVLDAHNRESCGSIYGIATAPMFPAGGAESVCTARFSKHNPAAGIVFKEIQDGIIRHWSFGYDVYRLERTEEMVGDIPVCLATQWEPFELSVVPVPADPSAGTRSKESFSRSCEVVQTRGKTMTDEEKKRLEEEEKKHKEEEKKHKEEEKKRQEEEEEKKRQEEEEKKKKGKKNEEEEEERAKVAKAEERARAAERRRIREIRDAVATLPNALDSAKVEESIDSGISADDFRRELLQAARERQPPIDARSNFEFGADAREKKRDVMGHAILHRCMPAQYPLVDAKGQQHAAAEFRGMNLLDLAKECLSDAGFRYRGYAPGEIARLALGQNVRGMHATTDYPILLSNTVNMVLRQQYKLAAQTYQSFCRRATVKDFKERNLAQIGDVSRFNKVLEGGEYKRGTWGEAVESYKVDKHGTVIAITWEAIINDEMDAFSRLPTSVAQESAQLCSDIVYGILQKNPVMGDGKPLFHADHGNIGTAADIDLDGMDAAFTAIGTQKNLAGRMLNLHPEHLLVGHGKRTKALQYLNNTVVPTKADDVTPAQMRGLNPIVEGRITGNQWFLFCSPGIIDTIEYAYLEGEEGLYTEERWGFDVDGLEIKARIVFGAKAIDWRGMYMNPGM